MELRKVAIRDLSGLVYCAVIIGSIIWGVTGVTLLAILFSILACIEFAKINRELTRVTIPELILDIIGCICLCTAYMGFPLILWLAVVTCRFILQLYSPSAHPLKDLSHSILTQVYIGVPLGIMAFISAEFNSYMLLAIFILIWINDTGAFCVGSMCGRHKLFERISPKKTWEGFWGGFAFCIIASVLFSLYCNGFFAMTRIGGDMLKWIVLGALVSVFGTWGDLIESQIKRTLHVKDSGNLIPGHGGILDRIDSLLLVMPVFAVYLAWILMV